MVFGMRFASDRQRRAVFSRLNSSCARFSELPDWSKQYTEKPLVSIIQTELKFSKHPREIGSVWVGGDYVHGPRIRQPGEFEFVKNVVPSGKFYHFKDADKIPESLPRGSKLVVGKLRKTGDWALQSTLIPKSSKLGKSLIRR